MTHITLITVGTLKEEYLRAAAREYEMRLAGLAVLERVELSEERIRDEDDKTAVAAALRAEYIAFFRAALRGDTPKK